MAVGDQIKHIRKEKGMTQKQVADACGMAASAIRKYESGVVHPKLATVSRIAEALEVDTLELTKGDMNYPFTFTYSINDESKKKFFFGFGESSNNRIKSTDNLHTRLSVAFDKLNEYGQKKAVELVELITLIPHFLYDFDPSPKKRPKSVETALEGKDTTPDETPTETPQNPPEDET